MPDALLVILGILVGAGTAGVIIFVVMRRQRAVTEQMLADARQQSDQQIQQMLASLKDSFSALSRDALSANTDDFLKVARDRFAQQSAQADQVLDTKKKLIDARLEEMNTKLSTLNQLIQNVEKQRAESHGSLKTQLERATIATNRLQDTTAHLREALANPQRRGQWGERMAEDVLRLAGFIEGVNYSKQKLVEGGTRPDFTFPLPGGRIVHMDVKFPLGNYLKMLDAPDDTARDAARTQFLRDVRSRIKEVTTRDYIDPAAGTVDYVLVFIPNEQIYGFIHEQDPTLLDSAMSNKVVLCSPLTLYAILAVMRQSAENYRLEQGAKQILELLAEFKKQWAKYAETMDKLGKRIDDTRKQYDELIGTRTRQLERQINKIDDLQESETLRADREKTSALPPPAEHAPHRVP